MDKVEEIQSIITDAIADMRKFEEGNKSAGKRVRKGMLQISKLAKEIRKDISEATKK